MRHTDTPWTFNPETCCIEGPHPEDAPDTFVIAMMHDDDSPGEYDEANGEHIVKCVNMHDELVSAIKAMCEEFRQLDLPYGSKAYSTATGLLNQAGVQIKTGVQTDLGVPGGTPLRNAQTKDGYTRWDFRDGFGPGTPDSEVEVECRAGEITRGKVKEFDWSDNDSPNDIYAYKFLRIAVPKLVTSEWTAHDGSSECPIDIGEIIEVKFKSGGTRIEVAHLFDWTAVASYRAAFEEDFK